MSEEMKKEPRVEMGSIETIHKKQRGTFDYINEREEVSSRKNIFGISLTIFGFLIIVFVGTPEKEATKSQNIIDIPFLSPAPPELLVPDGAQYNRSKDAEEFQKKLQDYLQTRKESVLAAIRTKKAIDKDLEAELATALNDFKATWQ